MSYETKLGIVGLLLKFTAVKIRGPNKKFNNQVIDNEEPVCSELIPTLSVLFFEVIKRIGRPVKTWGQSYKTF